MASKNPPPPQKKIKYSCKYKNEWANTFPVNGVSGDPSKFFVYQVEKLFRAKNKEEATLCDIATQQKWTLITTKMFGLKRLAPKFRLLQTHLSRTKM